MKASSLVHWTAGVSQNAIADAAVVDAGKSAGLFAGLCHRGGGRVGAPIGIARNVKRRL